MTDRPRSTAASRWGAVAACLALLTTGCTQAQQGRTLGIGPSDVDRIEVYLYTFSENPRTVTRSVVEDRREIAELVNAFTDMPVTPLRLSFEEVRGAKASGLRFHLRDGGAVEVTQVFRGPGDTVVVWPDSPAVQTEWGSGIGDHGTPGDPSANSPVNPEERPVVVLR